MSNLRFEPTAPWFQPGDSFAYAHPSVSSSGYERTIERDRSDQRAAAALARRFDGCERLLVVGIGGSAMGLRALADGLACADQRRRLLILDHLDVSRLEEAIEGVDAAKIGLIAISRSGGTIEVLAWLREVLGRIDPGVAAAVTARPDAALGRLAAERGWPTLPIPADVGGRFSVLTPCGLLPAAALGIDVEALLAGARDAELQAAEALADALMHQLEAGRSRWVQLFYGEGLIGLSGWWLQLVSESLGKAGLPLFIAAGSGPRDQHSVLQLLMEGADQQALIFCRGEGPERKPADGPDLAGLGDRGLAALEQVLWRANAEALAARGRPVLCCDFPLNPEGFGAFMQTWMRATAMLGERLGIDPFDQPGVEDGKILAKSQLGLMP